MITAVDTSVLVDVLAGDHTFGPASREALRTCTREGALVACDVVWAETSAAFGTTNAAEEAISGLGIRFDALTLDAALAAGAAWQAHRAQGGKRTRMIADFLIGAHAVATADRLLTRDRGFYRSYFRNLRIVDPSP